MKIALKVKFATMRDFRNVLSQSHSSPQMKTLSKQHNSHVITSQDNSWSGSNLLE